MDSIKNFFGIQTQNIDIEDYVKQVRDSIYWQAIRLNKLRTMKDLFLHKKLDVNDQLIEHTGHNLLHQSISLNKMEMFQLCLDFHADVNKVDAVGMTPLMRAVSLSRSKMVRKLLDKGADPYAQKSGKNSFDRAEFYENQEIFEMLGEYRKDDDMRQYRNIQTIEIDDNDSFENDNNAGANSFNNSDDYDEE